MALATQSGAATKSSGLTGAQRTAILKALADPRRFEVLERIARSSCAVTCSQTLADLPIAAATLSHHLKELEAAGLIHVRREGKYHLLSVQPGVLEAMAETLQALSAACPNAGPNAARKNKK
ncbi:ArsR/SmtB family transcription factor [Terracidiphilus sp.]|jgi:ArsR family transcriptional regulator|uniref:ArsR/SmtB family transcription factor n=1 Tax=Terracidiphilus sp. TaxID=1964191 RepID=UPI003C19ABF1